MDRHFLGPVRCCGLELRTLVCAVGAIIGRSSGRPGMHCSNLPRGGEEDPAVSSSGVRMATFMSEGNQRDGLTLP